MNECLSSFVILDFDDNWQEFDEVNDYVEDTITGLGNCFAFNISDTFQDYGFTSIDFHFYEDKNVGVQIVLQGSNIFTDRPVQSSKLNFVGDKIEMEKLEIDNVTGKGQRKYIVDIGKVEYIEEDLSKNCRNYPTEDHESYNDCDKHFVRKKLDDWYSKDLVPIWTTGNLDEVSTNYSLVNNSNTDYYQLFDGSLKSSCPLPCSTITIRSQMTGETFIDHPVIGISFDSTVEVTRTDFVEFSISGLLSDIGGSLGFWLGLGVLQAVQILTTYCGVLAQRVN